MALARLVMMIAILLASMPFGTMAGAAADARDTAATLARVAGDAPCPSLERAPCPLATIADQALGLHLRFSERAGYLVVAVPFGSGRILAPEPGPPRMEDHSFTQTFHVS